MADLLLLPMWDQFRFLLPHYRGVELIPEVKTEALPWVSRMQQWAAAVEQRESHKAVSVDKDRYIAGYKGYAGARGVSQISC